MLNAIIINIITFGCMFCFFVLRLKARNLSIIVARGMKWTLILKEITQTKSIPNISKHKKQTLNWDISLCTMLLCLCFLCLNTMY